jgi:membrane protease YdiL (CAAX protease family)
MNGREDNAVAEPVAGPPAELPAAPVGPPRWPADRAWAWKVVQWPLCRIVLALTAVLGTEVALLRGARLVVPPARSAGVAGELLRGAVLLLVLVAMHLVYRGYVRLVEWRQAGEVSLADAAPEAGVGAAVGGGLMTAAVAILWLAGFYHASGVRLAPALLEELNRSLVSGYGEELLARVIFFRILEELVGTRWALAVSASLFGLAHWYNPHSTLLSTLSIALAGVLLGAAFAMTRRIWLAAGLHFGWNFMQGGIFGVAVSGTGGQGLLMGSLSGPAVLSGGAFGIEGSLLSVVLCAAAAVPLLRAAARRGHVVPPAWSRAGRLEPGQAVDGGAPPGS